LYSPVQKFPILRNYLPAPCNNVCL